MQNQCFNFNNAIVQEGCQISLVYLILTYSVKIYTLIDELVKMYVLKIFITGDICHFGLAIFTEEP